MSDNVTPARNAPFQFRLRSLLIAMTVYAVLTALFGWLALGFWIVILGSGIAKALGDRAVIVQHVLLVLLIAAGLAAMQFTPYQRIYTDGVYPARHTDDPLFAARAGLVVLGLVGSVLCVAISAASLYTNPPSAARIVLQLSMSLCALMVGWALMPYWANGMFQAYIGNAAVSDFDPKALIPMVWLGDYWRLGVFLILLVANPGVPVLFLASAVLAFRRKEILALASACIYLAITAVVVLFCSLQYSAWLLD